MTLRHQKGILPRPSRLATPVTSASALLLGSWLCLAACTAPQYRTPRAHTEVREVAVTFQDPAPRVLDVQVHSGCVVLQPGPALQCRLRLEVSAATQEEAVGIADALVPRVDEDRQSGRTHLNVALPQGANLEALVVTCQIQVPPGTATEVSTRQGAVIARDLACDLTVDVGDGSLEAWMAGGALQAASDGGRITLRGSFPRASLRTSSGRIEVLIAPTTAMLDIRAGDGVVLLDLEPGCGLDVRLRGDQTSVLSTPEIRVEWQEVEMEGTEEYLLGRFGPPDAVRVARLLLDAGLGTVLLRRARMAAQ